MNFNDDYEPNLLDNRSKSFLTFSAVDNEFLSENNFVVLNLDNEEVTDPENLFDFATENCEQLQNAVPDLVDDSRKEIADQPKPPHRRRRNKQTQKGRPSRKSWPCDLCDGEFPTLKELKVHKSATHVLTKFYKCQECFREFNLEKNFMLHLATHTAAPARCPECGTIFQRISSFIGHVETHMGDDSFKCKECDVEFEFEEYHERHMQTVHKEANRVLSGIVRKRSRNASPNRYSKKYLCKICGKSFPKLSLLVRHEMGHTKTKPFECLECSQRFSQKSSLQRHYLVHEGIKPFSCPECSLRFSQRTNLVTHIKRVHPAKEDLGNRFQCHQCPCAFSKLKSLNRHITLTHSKVTRIVDDDLSINEFLEQIRGLKDDPPHQYVINKNSIPSPVVNTTQRSVESTFETSNIPHHQRDNIACVTEEAAANLAENLYHEDQYINLVDHFNPNQDHAYQLVREVHVDGVKRLECLRCQKRFQRSFDIVRHMRVHTKERPFECEMCGRKFSLKRTMDIHMKTHKGSGSGVNQLYQCHACGRDFQSARRLEHHVRLHHNDESHQCPDCSETLNSNLTLSTHQKIFETTTSDQEELSHELIPQTPEEDDEPIVDNSAYYLEQQRLSNLGLQTFKCLTCQRQFTSESSLQNHLKLHLTNRTKEDTFLMNSDLKKNFACPHCHQTFETNGYAYHQHISSHVENVGVDESIEQVMPPQNLADDPLPCNYILLLDDPNAGNIDLDDLNLVLQQPDDLLFVDFTKMPETEISESPDHFLDMIGQPDGHQNDLDPHSEFINIEDLPNTKNHLSKNIVVVSHDKEAESSETSHPSSLVGTSTQTHEFLFQEVRNNKIGEATDKQKVPRKKPPHVCHVCKRIFKKPIDLRRHIRTHTKEKPFQCDVCAKAFSLKCTLDDHKLIHCKDRPTFDCPDCGKKYASKNVLNIHLRLHTGERPYKCEMCFKSFRTSGHRIVHMMRMHSKGKTEASKRRKR